MPNGLTRQQRLLIVAGAIAILIVGVLLGRTMALQELQLTQNESDKSELEEESLLSDTTAEQTFVAPTESVIIPESAMTDGQQKALQFVGVDTDEIVITPEMFACAEASIGNQRMAAIQNGDTPSVVEGAKLLTCYNE